MSSYSPQVPTAVSQRLGTEEEMMTLVQSFPEVHLFLGYGAKAQYADVTEVLQGMEKQLLAVQERCAGKPWLAIYGGDISNEAAPDLGWLMASLRRKYNARLLAIQSAGTPDTTTDYHFICDEQYEEVQSADAAGGVVTGREVLYGGTRHGVAVGGTRYYMGAKLIKAIAPATKPILGTVFVAGGGGVAKQEIVYADEQAVPWVYIPSRAGVPAVYGSTFGPVHDWVKARLELGAPEGKPYACVTGNH
ncbi:MAG: hypothetical protein WDW38_008142 [Sanguina aurantia]